MNNYGKIEWFGGNQDALNMYRMFVDLAHIWDDLIDKDKEISERDINNAFLICLVYLPLNPFYQLIQRDIMPMWITVVSSYEVANKFEREKDERGLEAAHMLRYAAGNILAYAIHIAVGPELAAQYVPEMWKDVVNERFAEYRKEHLHV
jgi:purine-cytosine permease-like protein